MSFNKSGVDWEQANCAGLDTELFYNVDLASKPRRLDAEKKTLNKQLREVCMACPIWQECLSWAFKNEDYGFWGGLNEFERGQLKHKRSPHGLFKDLAKYGISERLIRSLM